MRPVLLPAASRLWRDRTTLQIGRSGPSAVVLVGVDEPTRSILLLLDGGRSREQVLAEPGGPPVLELLERAGLIVDADEPTAGLRGLELAERDRLAPDAASLSLLRGQAGSAALRARRAARVLVRGADRIGGPLAALLSAAGIGTVDVVDDALTGPQDTAVGGLTAADVGRPRGPSLAARLVGSASRSVDGGRRDGAPRTGAGAVPDLVVLAGGGTEDASTAALLVASSTTHLLVDVVERTGLVGPLVVPGRTSCLRCLELTRSDLDPAWPLLAAQLAARGRPPAVCDGVLAVAVAAQAALQVLEHVEGGVAASTGGTLELELPGWRWRRRSWPVHQACGCSWTVRRDTG